MSITNWIIDNYIEILGAVTGIIYVFFEIRQTIWLWPLGIITSAIYIWVFFTSKFYADMGLQGYYLFISVYGWYLWTRERGVNVPVKVEAEKKAVTGKNELPVTRIILKTAIILSAVFILLFACLWYILEYFTDSPVPGWDSFLTALSVIATWMLARKIFEHWLLWIVVDIVSMFVYMSKGLYPTVVLFGVYSIMAFVGFFEWRKSLGRL